MSLWIARYADGKIGLTVAHGMSGEPDVTVQLNEQEINNVDLPVGQLTEVKLVDLCEPAAK